MTSSLFKCRPVAAVLATVAGLALVQSTPALAAPAKPAPTPAARAAGVEPGNAQMGWRQAAGNQPAARVQANGPAKARAFVPSGVLGVDVSSHQRTVNWEAQAEIGKRFAYVKATEGTSYKNPYFRSQYNGAWDAGLVRGAYHFASPSGASGKKQAAYFVKNGGGWKADGHTLPGVLDIEYNPYGATCYGLSTKAMVSWINSFVVEYKRLTKRDAVIYTTTDWWTRCTGNTSKFSQTNPLWAARYGTTSVGKLPGTWKWATFWQYTSTPIDQNKFSSTYGRLLVLAKDAA